jgi:hypothetical protein
MTRGRHSNTALVVTDPADLDHTPTEDRTAREVLTGALQRVSGEGSAPEGLPPSARSRRSRWPCSNPASPLEGSGQF